MKKGIIVLLITVLAAGMAFATFTGSASINFGVSLDEKGWGFTNTQKIDEYSFTFALDTQSATKGADHQTDIWAEIEAAASGAIELKKGKDAPAFTVKAEITTANIHVYDFTIGILGPKAAYGYASSWTLNDDSDPNYDFANSGAFETLPGGFNVSYQGYTASFGINNAYTAEKKTDKVDAAYSNLVWFSNDYVADLNTEEKAAFDKKYVPFTAALKDTTEPDGKYYAEKIEGAGEKTTPASTTLSVYASAETKSYEIAEGMTVQAATNLLLVGKDSKPVVGAAAKYAFAADKLSVGVAADFQFDANNEVVALDAKADAKYDIVSGAVYFGSDKLGKDGAKYIIEAKVGADIPVAENVTIKVAGEVDDLNVALKEKALEAATYTASVGTTVDKITANASFAYNAVIDKVSAGKVEVKGMKIAGDVTYKAEMLTAKTGISVGMTKNADETVLYNVKPSASISSTTIVEGAELSLGYAGANLLAEDYKAADSYSKGSITAGAKISF
mgnify:FL=1